MYNVVCYAIDYSGENKTMFHQLREIGAKWRKGKSHAGYFEIYISMRADKMSALEEVMKWYV